MMVLVFPLFILGTYILSYYIVTLHLPSYHSYELTYFTMLSLCNLIKYRNHQYLYDVHVNDW